MVGREAPNPESRFRAPDGREVEIKVHRCRWSGDYPDNSLPAILECYQARVARAEIDFAMLRDGDFLIVHDVDLAQETTGSGMVRDTSCAEAACLRLSAAPSERPALLSEALAAIATEPYPTILELDMQDRFPWPWPRVEELVRMLEPVKERVTFGGSADWNLRRLLRVDPTISVGFTITGYLDWAPDGETSDQAPTTRGAYGYLDDHLLARARQGPTADYLWDRLSGILRLVPGAREAHIRLAAIEQMRRDGLTEPAAPVHAAGMLLDAWTLNAGTPRWRERLAEAVLAGADVVTSDTPRELAAAGAELSGGTG